MSKKLTANNSQRVSKEEFLKRLSLQLDSYSLQCSEQQCEQLAQHFLALQDFGAVHNLTAIYDFAKVIDNHYIDCLKALSFLAEPPALMDIGSGAGFPGIMAAIMWPQTKVILVESVRKKCSFLQAVSVQCGLKNVSVSNENFYKLKPEQFIITRAAFPLPELLKLFDALPQKTQLAALLSTRQSEEFALLLAAKNLTQPQLFNYQINDSMMTLALCER